MTIALSLARNGCHERAEAALLGALAVNPKDAPARAELIRLRRELGRWDGFDADQDWLNHAVALGQPIPPLIAVLAGLDMGACQRAARRWGQATGCLPPPMAWRPLGGDGPIQIGYLSADFHTHATAFLIAEVLERHDRGRFRVSAYSLGPDDGGPERRRIVQAVDRFVDLGPFDDDRAAARIAADGIDLLIDLKGYTTGTRMGILARRPAPVQIGFLGYPGTLGHAAINYLIADRVVAPAEDAGFYDERLLYMPHCYQPNDSRRHCNTAASLPGALGVPPGSMVFACFNTVAKITPDVFSSWMRILGAVPDGVLCLLGAGSPAADNLSREAALRGINPDRIVFLPRVEPERHLGRMHAVDLFLDTWPYGAHTVAADALWEGLPMVTRLGEGFAARVGASLLQAAGLPELVTTTPAEYEALAIALACTPDRLTAARARLRARTGPLYDMAGYVRALEDLFLDVHRRQRRLIGQ